MKKLRFDPSLRARADEALFGKGTGAAAAVEEEDEDRSRDVALALLDAAMEPPDEDAEDFGEVRQEDQMSLSVGIVGAPNAGKSSLTNTMVRTASKRMSFVSPLTLPSLAKKIASSSLVLLAVSSHFY